MESKNIYAQLASLSHAAADKITNSKTGGGRSLNAIHASKLTQIEKHLLLVLGSEMNFCKDFINQYRYISLNDLAEKLSINQRTVSAILNGVKRKDGYDQGLIEKGYVKKQIPTIQEQLKKHWKTTYCITPKIFDEYMILLIEKEKRRIEKEENGSDRRSEDPVIVDQRTSDLRSDKDPSYDPSYKDPSNLNAVVEKPAAIKKEKKPTWKPSSKMKTWEEKNELDKMDCVLHKAIDAHDLAIEMRQAKYFPYADVPDLLAPILNEHGIDKCKEFFEALKNENRGCDVRKLSKAMKRFACHANVIPAEPIPAVEPVENFPEEIIKQMETNKMYIATSPIKIDEVKVESFPVRLKKFYDSLKSKREKVELKKEVSLLGLEKFLSMRATMILRCSYEELFIENVNKPAFL